jgi:ATP-dependent RNA helicase DeaD
MNDPTNPTPATPPHLSPPPPPLPPPPPAIPHNPGLPPHLRVAVTPPPLPIPTIPPRAPLPPVAPIPHAPASPAPKPHHTPAAPTPLPEGGAGGGLSDRDPADPTDPVSDQPFRPAPATDLPDDLFEQVTFGDLGLRDSVVKSLEAFGFRRPTKIQALLIPVMLKGKDVLGQARTGTGKTAAFGLPLLDRCEKGIPSQALVLVPTRELCVQVADEINELGRNTPIKALAVFGGERIRKQVDSLKRNPEIVVSTPGRLMDMVERGFVRLDQVRFAVLDEVDRMLDIGFRDDIRRILNMCPPPGQRQTVFVSATISPDIERLARSHAKDAEKVIAVYTGALTNSTVRQFYLGVQPWDKRRLLVHLLTHEEPALTVVFCRMKRTVDELTEHLNKKGIDAHAIHGDMAQNKRLRTIEKLHKGDLAVLVASDLASRGIDVDGITHVINYDMPEDPEVYVHRIGRTARVGRDGVAWSLVTPDQGDLLTNVENLINAEIPKLDYPDFTPSEPPPGRGPAPRRVVQPVNRYAGPALPAGASAPAGTPAPAANDAPPASHPEHAATPPPAPAPTPTPALDPSKFPGGVIPGKLPPNRMWGKVKTRGR